MNLESAFEVIYGRFPKPEETARFNRLAKELDIRDNDAVWSLVFLLGHHLELADAMPVKISLASARVLSRFDEGLKQRTVTAEKELEAAKARVEQTLSETVVASAQREIARSAQAVARSAATKSWLQWLGGAALAGMIALAGAFAWGYGVGQRTGYASALDVKEAGNWASTASGQASYQMDRSGELSHLIRCDQAGWRLEKNKTGERECFVYPDPYGAVVGWRLPH